MNKIPNHKKNISTEYSCQKIVEEEKDSDEEFKESDMKFDKKSKDKQAIKSRNSNMSTGSK